MTQKPRSLRWRLIGSLVTLQVAASLLVLFGFLALMAAAGRFVDEGGERAAEIIGGALGHTPEGRLVLRPDEEAQWLLDAAPALWFVARDARGEELHRGEVPPRYRALVRALGGMERAALDLAEPSARPAARFERIETPTGPVDLIVQTRAPLSPTGQFAWVTIAFLILVAPILLVTGLVVVIATPFVIRRGLAGVVATAARAEQVDIDRLATRLPLDGVAAELRPLVEAVNRAFDRLDEGYRRQERFLADAAHELRTPITTLRIQVESLPEHSPEKSRLVRATTRLVTLAEQLLDLERLRRVAAVGEPVDLRALCERVAADLAPLVILQGGSISVEAPRPVFARADATSIERAVSNLVQNATEHGGEGCEIQIHVRAPAVIEVCDSGPGIPVHERERVVAPFHRLQPRGSGAGLGLHLVAEVARLHHGSLTIGAAALGGARMRLALGTGL